MSNIKQVIVIRKDLKNSKGEKVRSGKLISQGAHASMKVFFDRIEYCDHGEMKINEITPEMEEWIDGTFTKIVLSVDSEKELFDVYFAARDAYLPCAMILDSGLTEFSYPTNTCCAIGPAQSEDIDKITGNLKLF